MLFFNDNDESLSLKNNIREIDRNYIVEQTKIWEVPVNIYNDEFKQYIEFRYSN